MPWWVRKIHWCFICFGVGFAMFNVSLSLPDIATEQFGGVGVCPAHVKVASEACNTARGKAQLSYSVSQGLKAFLGLFMGPSLGSISDVYGRQFFVLGALGLTCLSEWLLLATVYGYSSIWIYLVVDACTGAVPLLPALLSVIADESSKERRAANFGLLLATFELPLLFIPLLAAALTLEMNVWAACIVSSVSLVLAVAYGETLPRENRRTELDTTDKFWLPHRALAILNSAPIFRRLSVVILCNTLVTGGLQVCFLLYVESAFNMARPEATSYFSVLAIGGLFAQIFMLPFLTRFLGLSRTMLVAIGIQFVQNVCLLIRDKNMLMLSCGLGGFASMVFPCVSALKANAAPEDQQGRIQGAVSGLQSFAQGIGPLIFGPLFSYLQQPGSKIPEQMAFALSLAILLPALLAGASLHRVVPDNRTIAPDSTSLQQSALAKDSAC